MEAPKQDSRQLQQIDCSPRPQQIEWRRAWRALRRIIEDPDRTEDVFELIDAVSGPSFDRWYARFRKRPESSRLLLERPAILEALDRERLALLPPETLGRAYADTMTRFGRDAEGLVEASQASGDEDDHDDPDRDYFGDRVRDSHDLWHVVTGYGMDDAGEAALVAFSYGQSGMTGFAVLTLAGMVIAPRTWTLAFERYLFRAFRRGLRARPFDVTPWEKWLELPLDEVRRRLRVDPPEVAHPEGIIEMRMDLTARA